MKMRELLHKNLTDRVVIFINSTKGRKVTKRPYVRGIIGNVGQTRVKMVILSNNIVFCYIIVNRLILIKLELDIYTI